MAFFGLSPAGFLRGCHSSAVVVAAHDDRISQRGFRQAIRVRGVAVRVRNLRSPDVGTMLFWGTAILLAAVLLVLAWLIHGRPAAPSPFFTKLGELILGL
jgi:hypothetical protein